MLRIHHEQWEQLRSHGEAAYPNECCGVLLGHSGEGINTVSTCIQAGNTRTDSAHNRYNIAPAELVRIQRQARRDALEIIGFYHSHPDHPARWSETDLQEAHWLTCSYVITAVTKGRAEATNSFLLTGHSEEDKQFVDEPIELVP